MVGSKHKGHTLKTSENGNESGSGCAIHSHVDGKDTSFLSEISQSSPETIRRSKSSQAAQFILQLTTIFHISLLLCVVLLSFCIATPSSIAEVLSSAEREYLAVNKVIKVACQFNSAPYQYKDIEGNLTGFSIELLEWISDDLEFTIAFSELANNDAIESVNSGVSQILSYFIFSETREKQFNFSQPISEIPVSIFTIADRFDIMKLSDLKDKRIVIIEGTFIEEFLERKGISFTAVPAKNQSFAATLLIEGKADAVIAEEIIFKSMLHRERENRQIKRVGSPVFIADVCFATPEENVLIIEILRKGIKRAEECGVLSGLRNKWFGVGSSYSSFTNYHLLLLAFVISVLCAMLVFVLLKYYLLKKSTKALHESNNILLEIENSSSLAIFRLSSVGDVLSVNKFGEDLFGFKKAELIGQNVIGTIVPHTESTGRDLTLLIKKLCEDPRRQPASVNENMRKDGSRLWVSWTNHPILDENGEFKEVLCIASDVTFHKQTAKKLKEAEKKHQLLLNSTGIPIVAIDEDMVIQYCNLPYSAFMGIPIKDLEGQNLQNIVPGFTSSQTFLTYRRVLESGITQQDDQWHDIYTHHVKVVKTSWGILAIGRSCEEKIKGKQDRLKTMARIQKQHKALLKLATQEFSDPLNCTGNLRRITSTAKQALAVDNVSLFFFGSEPLFKGATKYTCRYNSGNCNQEFFYNDYKDYFDTLTNTQVFVSKNVQKDPRTDPFRATHLDPHKVKSMMDAGIWWKGNLIGAVCFDSSVVIRNWSEDEILFAISISEQVSLAISTYKNAIIEDSRKLLAAVVEQSSETIMITDHLGNIEYVNPVFESVSGYSSKEVMGLRPTFLESGMHSQAYLDELWSTLDTGRTWRGKLMNARKDGSFYEIETVIFPLKNTRGDISNFVGLSRVLTGADRLKKIDNLQVLKTSGLLAAEIATDYNNLLIPIIGYSRILLDESTPGTSTHSKLSAIYSSASKSKELTKQLIAFGGKQRLKFQSVNLNAIIANSRNMLKTIVQDRITLEVQLDHKIGAIQADSSQIELALINLVVNSCEAITDKGTLKIVTGQEFHSEPSSGTNETTKEREFVTLEVIDDGCGISRKNLSRIFEPFFTTKHNEKRPGMGLSTVFGIINQHSGFIEIDSNETEGTAFKIFIPLDPNIDEEIEVDFSEPQRDTIKQSTSTPTEQKQLEPSKFSILVAEDDSMVLSLVNDILSMHGYNVILTENGKDALHALKQQGSSIHLLLTDVGLRGVNGAELYKQAKLINPAIRVAFISGYSEQELSMQGLEDKNIHFLHKPFRVAELISLINQALG